MELNPELAPFIAAWERAGFSEDQIAKLIERHTRLADADEDDDAETWCVERAEDDGDTDLLDEPLEDQPADAEANPQPGDPSPADPEVKAAVATGLIIMADPGNEPKQTREPPERVTPRAGRLPVDITSPQVKRMLERLRPRSLAEIAELKPPQWLIARHIPENSLIALFGRFSTCKSFLAMAWGLSIASGKRWLGRSVQQGHVFYVSAEGTSGIDKRARAFCKENGLAGPPESFHAITCSVDMTSPEVLDYLAIVIKQTMKEAKGEKPKLIVIDTLNRCFGGGDENSTKDMSAFVAGCDAMREEFGASVLIIHHTGHDAGKGARGATALPSAIDIAFVLTKPKGSSLAILKNEDPAKPHKDSAALPDRALEFVEVEIDELEPNEDDPHATTSLVVRAANAQATAEAERARAAKRRTGADETLDTIRTYENGITLPELVKSTGKDRSTLRSRCKKLLADGRIRQDGERFFVVDQEMSFQEEFDELLAMQS
jgi:hypothetical protein